LSRGLIGSLVGYIALPMDHYSAVRALLGADHAT
jgi:hypothetical protein